MLSTVRGARIEPAYILACFGSCRTGESSGVRCEEVEFGEFDGVLVAFVPVRRRIEGAKEQPLSNR